MFWILAAMLGIAALAFVLRPLLKPPCARRARRQAPRPAGRRGRGRPVRCRRSPRTSAGPAARARRSESPPRHCCSASACWCPRLRSACICGWAARRRWTLQAGRRHRRLTTMEEAIAALEARLEAQPNDVEGWMLLGRSRRSQEDFAAAEAALAAPSAWQPDDIEIQLDYAEAKALATPTRRFAGESLALLEQAYQREPGHARAAWLLGIAAVQDGRPADAAKLWEPILAHAGRCARAAGADPADQRSASPGGACAAAGRTGACDDRSGRVDERRECRHGRRRSPGRRGRDRARAGGAGARRRDRVRFCARRRGPACAACHPAAGRGVAADHGGAGPEHGHDRGHEPRRLRRGRGRRADLSQRQRH
jgi:hypothetical protein